MKHNWMTPIGAIILLLACSPLFARPRVIAVLSSNLGPYQMAFDGFQEAFGEPVEKRVLGGDHGAVPVDADVIVAFGGKAATAVYPDDSDLIYGLALGVSLEAEQRRGQTAKIFLIPEPAALLQRFKILQPGLKRLLTAAGTEGVYADYSRDLTRAGRGMDVEIVSLKISDASDLVEKLRSVGGDVDAFWVAPDPHLLNAETFELFKGYCMSRRLPLYLSLDGFMEKGAAAAIYIDYLEAGRTMGQAAKRVLKGEKLKTQIYPAENIMSVNQSAAARYGLILNAEALKAADEVLP